MIKHIKEFLKLAYGVFGDSVQDKSPKKKLDEIDFAKLVRNGLIYGAGAFIAYALGYALEFDYGVYTPIIIAVISGLLDAVRRAFKNNV